MSSTKFTKYNAQKFVENPTETKGNQNKIQIDEKPVKTD
jgi:hypothetical protein